MQQHEIADLRQPMAAIIRRAMHETDRMYRELLGKPDDSEPVGRVPVEMSDWPTDDNELIRIIRLATWNAYDRAIVHAEHLDMTDHSTTQILNVLREIEVIEGECPVPALNESIHARNVRDEVLELNKGWFLALKNP